MQDLLEIQEFEEFKEVVKENSSPLGKVIAASLDVAKSQANEIVGEITLASKAGDTLVINRVRKTIPLKEIEKTDDVDAMQIAYQKAERETVNQMVKNLEAWIADFKKVMKEEGIIVVKGIYSIQR